MGVARVARCAAELRAGGSWGRPGWDELDAKIAGAEAADPHLWFVSTDSLTASGPAPTLGTLGNLELGRLMARAYGATLP